MRDRHPGRPHRQGELLVPGGEGPPPHGPQLHAGPGPRLDGVHETARDHVASGADSAVRPDQQHRPRLQHPLERLAPWTRLLLPDGGDGRTGRARPGALHVQKEPNISIPKMEKIMENFYAPDDTMYWWEKLGGHVSAASRHNLIDMAFTNQPYDIKHMKSFLAGWYYYDAAVILMDHVVSIHQDLRNGIANLSLIAMREKELRDLTSLKNYNPHLTIDDYDGHLRRIADLTSKAIRLATTDVHDDTLVYPFMTIMMPVVMMADWIGNRDDMIHTFLEAIAPTIRRVAGNGAVPAKGIAEAIDEVARSS